MKKTIGLMALLTALALALTACGGGSIEGVWDLTSVKGDGLDQDVLAAMQYLQMYEGTYQMIFSDGVCTTKISFLEMNDVTETTYQVDGNKIIMGGSEELEYSIKGNTLTLTLVQDGSSMIFTRQ